MKIAINARFLTQRITGVQRYACDMTKEIIKAAGCENIRLLSPSNGNFEYAGVPVHTSRGYMKGHIWEQFALPLALKSIKADILWSPGNTGPLAVTDQVVVIHDVGVFTNPDSYNSNFVRWYRMLLPRLAQKAKKIITVSEFSKREIEKYLNVSHGKVAVIPGGVSGNFKPADKKTTIKFKKDKGLPLHFVLWLASRAPHKNFSGIIKAWEFLCKKNEIEDVWLVIAGGIHQTLNEDTCGSLGELKNVLEIGYVSDEDLPLLYNSAEALVFPSFYEGFGLPPLEAMACGTPVVVSRAASLPEVVGDAGIYVNPNDIEDIARGINIVIKDNELRDKMVEYGMLRAGFFTWEKAAKQTLDILADVVYHKGMLL